MNLGEVQANSGTKQEYAPLPDGEYPVTILEVNENKKSKNGSSVYDEITFKIEGGEFKDRRIWDRFFSSGVSGRGLQVSRDRQMKLLKAVLGNDAEKVVNGEKGLDAIVGRPLSVKIATKGKYTNVQSYIAN